MAYSCVPRIKIIIFESMNRIEKLQEFLRESPDDSFLKHALALEMIKLGADEEAQALFESNLQADPGYLGSYYHLGKLLERQREFTKALEIYRKGLEQATLDRHAYSELERAINDLEDDLD